MTNNRPIIGAPYRHVDGGFYRVLHIGKSTVDQTEHVVYLHLYPFEVAVWIRPLDEWTPERFTLTTNEEVLSVIELRDQDILQQQITAAKYARRAAQ